MTVRSLPARRGRADAGQWALDWVRVRRFARDWGALLAIIAIYFVLRGQAPANEDFAVRITGYLVDLEQATHTFWEPQIQDISIRWYAVQEAANFVYAYLHFPVLAAVGLLLWFRRRDDFVFIRNVMYISMVIGLIFYYLIPAAPPRLLALHGDDLGFTDTVFGGHTSVSYAQPSILLNEYAAIPSFHFGWIALAAAGLWINSSSWVLRGLGIFLSALMSWAIIASANHLIVDMVMGGVAVAAAWYLARRLESWRARPVAAAADSH